MFYLDLFSCLNKFHVRYAVVGGLAMNLHGVPRMTMDIDLVLLMDDENLERFIGVAEELKLNPGVPVNLNDLRDPVMRARWSKEKNMVAFPLRTPRAGDPTVDILIQVPIDVREIVERSDAREIGGINVAIASVDDLVRMKEASGRAQDLADIEHLRRL